MSVPMPSKEFQVWHTIVPQWHEIGCSGKQSIALNHLGRKKIEICREKGIYDERLVSKFSNSSLITHTQSFCDLVLPVAGTWYSSVEYHTINLLQYKLVHCTMYYSLVNVLYTSVTLCGIETSSIYCMTYFYIALALCSHLCMYNVLRGVHIVKVRYK